MAFNLKGSSATKKFMENQGSKSRFNQLKISKDRPKYKFLILGQVGEASLIGETNDHTLFVGGKFLGSCTSPEVDGGKDKLNEIGFKLFGKYGKSDSKKLSQLHKHFFSKKEYYVNVIDFADIDGDSVPEPKVLKIPKCLYDLITEKISALTDADGNLDLTEMCCPENGLAVMLRHNGAAGMLRKYKVDFSKKPVNLISKGVFTEEDLENLSKKCYDLDRVQRPFNAEDYEKFYGTAKKLVMEAGVDVENLSEDSETTNTEEDSFDSDLGNGDIESDFE